MRIIAGEFRSRTLVAPDTDKTRPTTDRARESLFNVLVHLMDIDGISVLDLFAGSGAIGIEAVSRGAGRATFIEQGRKALQALRSNIAAMKLEEKTTVIQSNVYRSLVTLSGPFDLIIADPPYDDDRARAELSESVRSLLAPEGLFVLEHRSTDVVPEAPGYERVRELKAGEAGFTILRLKA